MNIFISKNGTRQGPYSPEQLKNLVRRREVSMSDLAWHEGCTGWAQVSNMPELVNAILPPVPPERPPTFEHENEPNRLSEPASTNAARTAQSHADNATTSQTKPRFWPDKPTNWKGWLGLTLLASPVWGLLILFVCLGLWSCVAWEIAIIAGIFIFFSALEKANDWAGPKLFTFGRRHIRISGTIILAGSALTLLLGLGLAYLACFAPNLGFLRLAMTVGALAMLTAGVRGIKLGWNGIAARNRRGRT